MDPPSTPAMAVASGGGPMPVPAEPEPPACAGAGISKGAGVAPARKHGTEVATASGPGVADGPVAGGAAPTGLLQSGCGPGLPVDAAAGAEAELGEGDEVDDELADDALFNVQKMAAVLEEGNDDEKTVVLFEMAQLLDHCLADALSIMVPAICSLVLACSVTVRASAAEALLDVANLPDLPHETAKLIASTALESIDPGKVIPAGARPDDALARYVGSEDETQDNIVDEVLNLWAEILSAVLRLVKWEPAELQSVTRLLDFHAFHNRDVSRKLAARVLGSLATSLPNGQDVEDHVLPTALALCDDAAIEVRGMVSESLALVAGRVSLRTLERVVWPKMVRLLADPDARVHAATLRTVAHVAVQHAEPYVPPSSRAATAAAAAAAAAAVAHEDLSGAFPGSARASAANVDGKGASAGASALESCSGAPTGRRASTMTKEERQSRTRLLRELLTPVVVQESAFAMKAASEDQRYVDDYTYLLLEIVAEVFGPLVWAVLRGDGQAQHTSASKLLGGPSRLSSTDTSATPLQSLEAETVKAFRAMAVCNGPIVRRHCAFNMPGVAAAVRGVHLHDLAAVVESLSRDKDAETRWNLAAGLHETAFLIASSGFKPAVDSLVQAAVALLQDEHALVRMNALEHFSELLPSLVQGEQGVFVARRLAPLFANLRLLSEGNWRTQWLLSGQVAASAYLMPAETLREAVLPLLYRMAEESTYLVRMSVMGAVATCMWHIADPEERAVVMGAFVSEWAEAGLHWMRLAFVEAAVASASLFSRVLFRDVFASATLRLAADPVPNVRLRLVRAMPALGRACAQMDELHRALDLLHQDTDPDVRVAVREVAPALEACLRHSISADADDERREDEELTRRELVLSSGSVSSGRLDSVGGSKRHKQLLKKGAVSLMKTVRTSLQVTEEAVAIRRPAGLRLAATGGAGASAAGAPSPLAASPPTGASAAQGGGPSSASASPRAASPTSSAGPSGAFSSLTSLTSSNSRDSPLYASPRSLSSVDTYGSGSDWLDELSDAADLTDSSSALSPLRRLSLRGKPRGPSLDGRGAPSGGGGGGKGGPSAPGPAATLSAAASNRLSPSAALPLSGAAACVSPKHGTANPGGVAAPVGVLRPSASQDLGSPISSDRFSPSNLTVEAAPPGAGPSPSSSLGAKMNLLGHRPSIKDLKDLKARVNRKLMKK